MEALADFLTDSSTHSPLTVSIEGQTANDASFFLRRLDRALQNRLNQNYLVVRFNPSRYPGDETLWAALALEIERQLFQTQPWRIKWRFPLYLLWKSLDKKRMGAAVCWTLLIALLLGLWFFAAVPLLMWLLGQETPLKEMSMRERSWMGGIVSMIPLPMLIWQALAFLKDGIGKTVTLDIVSADIRQFRKQHPDHAGKIPFLAQFQTDIQKRIQTLTQNNRIYLLIDGLDSCPPAQAMSLLQIISLLFSDGLNLLNPDKLNMIAILAMDRKKLAAESAALHEAEWKYRIAPPGSLDRGPQSLDLAEASLDQFIQLAVPVLVLKDKTVSQPYQPPVEPPPHTESGMAFSILDEHNTAVPANYSRFLLWKGQNPEKLRIQTTETKSGALITEFTGHDNPHPGGGFHPFQTRLEDGPALNTYANYEAARQGHETMVREYKRPHPNHT
jgi:hypothetical protein